MKLKFYERKEIILLIFAMISAIFMCIGISLIININVNSIFALIIGIFIFVISLFLFCFFMVRISCIHKKFLHEKINYYLKDIKYTEVFFEKICDDSSIVEKIIVDFIETQNIAFFAILNNNDKTVIIKGIKNGDEVFSTIIDDYEKFFDYFRVKKDI